MIKNRKSVLIAIISIVILFASIIVLIDKRRRIPFKEADFQEITVSVDNFEFANIKDIGTVYHYSKSNLDRTNERDVWIYIASSEITEVFKIHSGSIERGVTDFIIAHESIKYCL